MHAAKEQLKAILHNISAGIIVQDDSDTIIYANEAAARITGYPSTEAIVKTTGPALLAQIEVSDEQGHLLSVAQLPGSKAVASALHFLFRKLPTQRDENAYAQHNPDPHDIGNEAERTGARREEG